VEIYRQHLPFLHSNDATFGARCAMSLTGSARKFKLVMTDESGGAGLQSFLSWKSPALSNPRSEMTAAKIRRRASDSLEANYRALPSATNFFQ